MSSASLPCIARAQPYGGLVDRLSRDVDLAAGTAVLLTAFLLTNIERMPHGFEEFLAARITIKNFLLVVGFGVVWRLLCVGAGLYDWRIVGTRAAEAHRVLVVAGVGSLVALVFPLISVTNAFRPITVLCFWFGVTVVMLAHRTALGALLASTSHLRTRDDIVIVGSGPRALKVYRQLCTDPESRANVLGFVDSSEHDCAAEIRDRTLGRLDQLETILMRRAIDQVLITLPVRSRYADVQTAIRTCGQVGVRVTYLADIFEHTLRQPCFDASSNFPVVTIPVAAEGHRLLIKRAADVLGATLGLIAVAPVIAVAAVAIKLSGPGPVIFAQERYGLNRRRFRMFKLRTMVPDAEVRQRDLEGCNEAAGPVFKIREDPRVTRVGRFLRRTSIDELPQLLNVIRGEMSLVGPRPLPVRDVHRFAEAALMRRFSMRPGITCLWQISGRSTIGFDDWIRLDLKYIDEWSLALDFTILAKTLPVVLRGTGAA